MFSIFDLGGRVKIMFKTVRKHIRAYRIRSIRIMKWTDFLVPVIQEENGNIYTPDEIEQLAYFRAVSTVDLLSTLARIRKDELILTRISRLPDLSQECRQELEQAIEQMKRERLERIFQNGI